LLVAGCGSDNVATPEITAPSHADFTGVWSGAFTTQKDNYWQLEDLTACFPGCTPTARAYYASVIEDPANDEKPVQALWGMAMGFMREELAKRSTPAGLAIQTANSDATDPNFRCVPYGLARAAVNPLPIEIRRDGENLTIVYEEWNQSRTIFMDGRAFPADLTPSRLGYSVGRYDGDALVIDTKGVEANLYYDFQSGGGHSAEATFVERYVIADGPRRLEIDMTVTDPVTLLEPHIIHKTWLSTPEIQLVEDRCGDIPGKFPDAGTDAGGRATQGAVAEESQ
jgi:hypothetical protein